MEQNISFQITPLDVHQLYPQVSRALEKRTELVSREKLPKMWALTDKLNHGPRVPRAVAENRRKRRVLFGLLDWALGVFLLMSGLMEPQELLLPLLVGAVGFGAGVAILWRNKRVLLGILNLVMGAVLCLGATGNPAELGGLMVLGVAGIAIGAAAVLTRRRSGETSFSRAAKQLLQSRNSSAGLDGVRVAFSEEGMIVGQEGEGENQTVSYDQFEVVLETEELLLPIYQDSLLVLQKKDLLTGTPLQLQELLSRKVRYITI